MVLNVDENGKLIIDTKEVVEQSKEKKTLFNVFKKKDAPKQTTTDTEVINIIKPEPVQATQTPWESEESESVKVLRDRLQNLIEENKRLKDMFNAEHAQIQNVTLDSEEVVEKQELQTVPVFSIQLHSKSRRDYSVEIEGDTNLKEMLDEIARCKMSINPEDKLIMIGNLNIDLNEIEGWTVTESD